VLAPVAVKVAGVPAQIVALFTTTTGLGLTVTVEVAVELHPAADVPVMVYVVVAAGFAVTLAPVVADKPVAGDQVYVDPPVAVKVTAGSFAHLVVELTAMIGIGFTVTVDVAVPIQPAADVPVIV
jgi:hypothetical protein